jgi:choline dehydrogenase
VSDASAVPDVVIAGGGSAACVLAARLSEDPSRRVVMIEAGPDFLDPATTPAMVRYGWGGTSIIDEPLNLDWGYCATATPTSGEIAIPRGRLIGGSGSINGQIFLRALPEDIDGWRAVAGPVVDWPTMDAAFRALETDRLFRIRRWPPADWVATQAAFVETCVASGYGPLGDHNAPDAMGAGGLPFNQDDRVRWSPPLAYLTAAVRARPNLEIRPRTVVRRIEMDAGRAVAVLVDGPDGSARVAAGEVIVAAGAIGTPHLLMLSGIGPADVLARHGIALVADRRGVGRNLRDHPKAWVEWRLHDDVALADPVPGLQTSTRYTATGSPNRGDMMLYPNSVIPGPEPDSRAFRIEVVDNLELSAGTVSLRSADPTDQPIIDLGFFTDPIDRSRLADGIHRAIDLGATGPLSGLLGDRILPADDALATPDTLDVWLDRSVMTGQHVSSTCRMGRADDPDAVVDGSGRVHGIAGLRIVDASIMPDSVRANIHATVLALAEVLAGRIVADA